LIHKDFFCTAHFLGILLKALFHAGLARVATGFQQSYPQKDWKTCESSVNLERQTKRSVAVLAKRCVAGSTRSTTRRGNDAPEEFCGTL
jgi:hypothetical protein